MNTEDKLDIASSSNPAQVHDPIPAYYTAIAPSGSTQWVQPPAQQVINKLPAYITDVASSEAAGEYVYISLVTGQCLTF